jgi:hypothetical protein
VQRGAQIRHRPQCLGALDLGDRLEGTLLGIGARMNVAVEEARHQSQPTGVDALDAVGRVGQRKATGGCDRGYCSVIDKNVARVAGRSAETVDQACIRDEKRGHELDFRIGTFSNVANTCQ